MIISVYKRDGQNRIVCTRFFCDITEIKDKSCSYPCKFCILHVFGSSSGYGVNCEKIKHPLLLIEEDL